ncbi:hypothetical protein COLO4_19590 [Corchorus olitorius]|uniref:Uncharacterized protein n=1 Tax=Corchorus olitorius TaxID=93759 RepID=A0A1R3J4V4_9ROSI|nr:hypothetical protein COLO4_19590 [Corchorus olitorius]
MELATQENNLFYMQDDDQDTDINVTAESPITATKSQHLRATI